MGTKASRYAEVVARACRWKKAGWLRGASRGAGITALLLAVGSVAAQDAEEPAAIGTGPSGNSQPGVEHQRQMDEAVPPSSADLSAGVTLQAVFSDNFNLAPEGRDTAGRSLELAPFVEGYARTARSRGDMSLRLRGLWYSAGAVSDSRLSPDVRANGDLSVVGDSLRIAGAATVFRNNQSPFSATSIDPAARSPETALYKAYAVSPYSLGRLGVLDYELRYRAQLIDPGGAGPGGADPGGADLGSTGQQVAGGLASSAEFRSPLGWSVHADAQRVDFEDDSEYRRASAEALAYLRVTPSLRLGGGVNYSHIDVLTDDDGDDSGIGPTGFFIWRPGSRTRLSGKYADTYYGHESFLRLAHRGPRWLAGLSYSSGLQNGAESGLLYFDPNALFSVQESAADGASPMIRSLAERRLVSGAGQALLFGQTGSALVFNDALIASLGIIRPRNSLLLSVFANDQEPARSTLPASSSTDIAQRGVSLTGNHRLNPVNAIFLSTQYLASESDQTQQEARLTVLTVGWQHNLSRQTIFSASLRASRQTSEGAIPSAEYRERAVIASIDHRFW